MISLSVSASASWAAVVASDYGAELVGVNFLSFFKFVCFSFSFDFSGLVMVDMSCS